MHKHSGSSGTNSRSLPDNAPQFVTQPPTSSSGRVPQQPQSADFVDPASFRAGMRQLTGAVCIIATANGTDKAGLTATAVCSVSAQPPRLLVGVNRSGRSSGLIRSVGRFSVNVLADADQTLAARFARPSESSDSRFEQGHWRLGVLGVPVLGTALATFECRIEQIVDSGTHGILFGDVVAVHGGHSLAGPLLYANGQFCRLRDGRESILDSGW